MTESSDFDLREFLPYLLNIAGERTSASFQSFYRVKYGLLRTDWRVLFHLGIYGELTAKEICERAHIHKTKVSRAVLRLEERRFLKRESVEHDRRFEKLSLTPSGQKTYLELKEAAKEHDNKILSSLSNEQILQLKQNLKQLAYD